MTFKEQLEEITKASSLANQIVSAESWNGYCTNGTEGQTWYDTSEIARLMQKLHPVINKLNKSSNLPTFEVEDATRFGNTKKSLDEDNYDLAKKLKHFRIQLVKKVYKNYGVDRVLDKFIKDLEDTKKICNYQLKQPKRYDKTFGAKKKKLNKLQHQASQVFLLKPYNDYLYLINNGYKGLTIMFDFSYDFSQISEGYYTVDRDTLIKRINQIKKIKRFRNNN